jgi:hypothetical protein
VPRGELATRIEPVTRALGLPIGAMRTGRSLAALAGGLVREQAARRYSEGSRG